MRSLLLLASLCPLAAHAEERRIMVTSFDAVRVEGPFEVELLPGSPGAVVSGEARAIDGVVVEVQDRVLVVAPGPNGWGGWTDARLTAPRIVATGLPIRSATVLGSGRLSVERMRAQSVQLGVSGAGQIAARGVEADELDVLLVGSGAIAVEGNSRRGSFRVNGPGEIDAAKLAVRDLTVTAESGGASRFTASETANVTALGSGSVTVAGGAACTVKGPGRVECGGR